MITRDELIDALTADPSCCHAGSLRGISEVYDYIPVLDAADAVLRLLGEDDE